jgi:hypothetical protein
LPGKAVAGAIVLASRHDVPLNFHVPIIHSVPRLDLLPISAADGLYADATMPPGGWPAGSLQAIGAHQNSSGNLLRSSKYFLPGDCSTISRITVYHGRNNRPTTAHPLAEHLDVCIVAQSGAGDAEMDASEADRAEEQGQHQWFTVPIIFEPIGRVHYAALLPFRHLCQHRWRAWRTASIADLPGPGTTLRATSCDGGKTPCRECREVPTSAASSPTL